MPVVLLEIDAADMRCAAGSGGALRGLVRVGLEPVDQFLEVVRRQGFPHDSELRIGRDQRDRLEIVQHVVWQLVDRAVDHMRAPMADTDRVAVGRGARDASDADRARRSGCVLDDDGLAERRPHPLAHDPRDRIGRAARGERHDQRDRARRIGLRPRKARHSGQRDSTRCQVQKLSTGNFMAVLLCRIGN